MTYNIVAESPECTVVSEYCPDYTRNTVYQSEAAMEKYFIEMLKEQGYEYLPIHCEADMIANLRIRLQKLNNYTFSDSEWNEFFNNCIANSTEGIEEKQEKYKKTTFKF